MESSCGRILIIPKGEYSNTTEYSRLDLVEYQGSSYIAKQTTIGHLPTDTDYWKPYVDISLKMSKAVYDQNENGIVDNAEKVNNHTVLSDVPSDAKYTDTKSVAEMDDVNVSSPATGEGLIWDGTNEEWSNGEITHPSRFSALEDVSLSSLGSDQILMYDGKKRKWANVSILTKPAICTWADGTDEEIVAALEAHYNDEINIYDYWTVGDERIVNLSAMSATGVGESHAAQSVTLVLSNVGGKTLATPVNGKTTCAFQVDQKHSLNEAGYMNSTNTNTGGWKSSARRTWCNSVYKNAIPSGLRGIFKEFINQSGTGGGSSSGVEDTTDTFALRAEIEVFGSTTYSVSGEGSQVTYYQTSSNRIKQVNGRNNWWWQRSPRSGFGTFCIVDSYSGSYFDGAKKNNGVAPYGVI